MTRPFSEGCDIRIGRRRPTCMDTCQTKPTRLRSSAWSACSGREETRRRHGTKRRAEYAQVKGLGDAHSWHVRNVEVVGSSPITSTREVAGQALATRPFESAAVKAASR